MNWSDPIFLRSASAVMQWLVIGLASLAVGLQTVKHYVDLREKRISTEISADKEDKLANENTIKSERIAKAEAALSETRKESEANKKELAALKRPRSFTPDQRESMLALLKKFPAIPIRVIYETRDSEATQFGDSIAEIFGSAGYAVETQKVTILGEPPGLYLGVRDLNNTPLLAPELLKLFSNMNLDIKPQIAGDLDLRALWIRVSSKPLK